MLLVRAITEVFAVVVHMQVLVDEGFEGQRVALLADILAARNGEGEGLDEKPFGRQQNEFVRGGVIPVGLRNREGGEGFGRVEGFAVDREG